MMYANKGMAGAFMTRVKTGAASGFAGALMVEPIIHTSQDQLQADYTMFNSVMNLGFGAALGGALHGVGGLIGDFYRARTGKRQPWEFVPEDDLNRAYMDAHEQEIFHAYRDANPSMSKEEAREAARLAAIKFDTWARGRAYDEHVNVKDYYDNWKPKWESYRNFEPADWREAVPAEWRNPNSKLGDAPEDLSYLRGYEGLSELNADAVGMQRFL